MNFESYRETGFNNRYSAVVRCRLYTDTTGEIMLTLNINYEVLPDRVITIKLPESVSPGRHELVIVVEENETAKIGAESNAEALMEFAGTIAAFKRIDGVEFQREVRAEWN
jgi:hypothetical protein